MNLGVSFKQGAHYHYDWHVARDIKQKVQQVHFVESGKIGAHYFEIGDVDNERIDEIDETCGKVEDGAGEQELVEGAGRLEFEEDEETDKVDDQSQKAERRYEIQVVESEQKVDVALKRTVQADQIDLSMAYPAETRCRHFVGPIKLNQLWMFWKKFRLKLMSSRVLGC